MQVDPTYGEALQFNHLKEEVDLQDDVLNVGLGVLGLIELLLAVPVIQDHLELLLVHAEGVGLADYVFVV